MRNFFVLMLSALLYCCANAPVEEKKQDNVAGEGGTAPGASKGDATESTLPPSANGNTLLTISNRPPTKGTAAEGNLCKVLFDETMPLFPLKENPDGRSFEMADSGGVYVVIISAGNTRSTFMLEPRKNDVALLSSVQGPECLSRLANFHMFNSGDGFLYDGGKYIKYKLEITKNGKGFNGMLTWDRGKEYGIRVRYKKQLD